MDLKIYDKTLNFVGIVDNCSSIQWNRKYFETGNFELHAPINTNNLALLMLENIITKPNTIEAGVIEDIQLIENSQTQEMVIKGRFLSSYLDRRLIKGTFNFNGKVEDAMRSIINKVSAIPLLELGTLNGFDETVSFQAANMNALKCMTNLSKSSNIGFRFVPDFENKKIVFETYKGTDRTVNQSTNNRVTFSELYSNLDSAEYRINRQVQVTKVVATATYTSDTNSKEITVEVGDGSGLELVERYVKANIDSKDIDEQTFTNNLKQAAQLQLSNISESFESDVNPYINFNYKDDYDIGDIVTVAKTSWGIVKNLRLTELNEIYETEVMQIVPTLGTPLPVQIDWSV